MKTPITKRPIPEEVIPRMRNTSQHFNIMQWLGIQHNDNIYEVEQRSLKDALNVLIDENNSLISRDVLRPGVLPEDLYIRPGYRLVDIHRFDDLTIYIQQSIPAYHTGPTSFWLSAFWRGVMMDDSEWFTTEFAAPVAPQNDRRYNIATSNQFVIIFMNHEIVVFDRSNPLDGWRDIEDVAYIPTTSRFVGGTENTFPRNQFTTQERHEYVWSNDSRPILPIDEDPINIVTTDGQGARDVDLEQAWLFPEERLARRLLVPGGVGADDQFYVHDNVMIVPREGFIHISYTAGEAWETIHYPQHGRLVGVTGLSDDGLHYFFVAEEAVHRLNLASRQWSHISPVWNTAGPIIGNGVRNISHFLTADVFCFITYVQNEDIMAEGQYIMWALGPTTGWETPNLQGLRGYRMGQGASAGETSWRLDGHFRQERNQVDRGFRLRCTVGRIVDSSTGNVGLLPEMAAALVHPSPDQTTQLCTVFRWNTARVMTFTGTGSSAITFAPGVDLTVLQAITLEERVRHYEFGGSMIGSRGTNIVCRGTGIAPDGTPFEWEGNTSPNFQFSWIYSASNLTALDLLDGTWPPVGAIDAGWRGMPSELRVDALPNLAPRLFFEGIGWDFAPRQPEITLRIGDKWVRGSQVLEEELPLDDPRRDWRLMFDNRVFGYQTIAIQGHYWFRRDVYGNLWTNRFNQRASTVLTYARQNKDSVLGLVPSLTYEATETFLVFENVIKITSNQRVDGSIKLYLPVINNHEFSEPPTALCTLSTSEVAIFFREKMMVCARIPSELFMYRYDYLATRINSGVRTDDNVVNTLEGNTTLFPTKRGFVAMSYQAYMHTADQELIYLTDNIIDVWQQFYADSERATPDDPRIPHNPIRILQKKNYIFLSNGTRQYLMFDIRTKSWWKFEIPVKVTRFFTDQDELQVVSDTLYDFVTDPDVYRDEVLSGHYDITWLIQSQPLHFGLPNHYKNLRQFIFHMMDRVNSPELKQTLLARIKLYRKRVSLKDPEVAKFKIDELRTFVQRFNYWKINELEFALSNDGAREVPTRMILNGFTIKFEVGEEVR